MAEGPSCRCQRAPIGAERRGGGPPSSLCRCEGRGGHGPDAAPPLATRVKELEEELTRVASDRDAFRSRAEEATASGEALAGQLGAEQSAHQLTKGALDEALAAAEASRTEAVVWRGKAEGESQSPRFIRFFLCSFPNFLV